MTEKEPITCRTAGKAGGKTTRDRYGPEHYAVLGRAGGTVTYEKYGLAHYAAMGKKGGSSKRKREMEVEATDGQE